MAAFDMRTPVLSEEQDLEDGGARLLLIFEVGY